jgi:hypothetical protein
VARPGESVTLTGAGLPPNTPIDVDLFSDPVRLGSTITDALGAFRLVVTIPADTPAGIHTIVITGPAGVPRLELPFTVTLASVVSGLVDTLSQAVSPLLGGSFLLARTGWSVLGAARAAAVLMVAGAILVRMAWRAPVSLGPSRRRRRRRRKPWN